MPCHYSSECTSTVEDIPLLPSLQHIKALNNVGSLVSFWTLLPEQQPGIVIERLNDDENEWKGRYEFPAYGHPHTSQV